MTLRKYDIETLMDDIIAMIKANLNTKITAINSEKNDFTLAPIADGAYFAQSMNDAQANFNPFVYVGVIDLLGESRPSQSSLLVDIAAIVAIADEGNEGVGASAMWRKLFRYHRALKEVIEEGFENNQGYHNLKVKSLVPVELALINDSYSHKAIGISVTAEIG